MADRGEGGSPSSCTPTASGGGDGGIIKATFRKDVRMGESGVEKWLPGAEMTHPEKRKSLSWTARGGDQSQAVYGEKPPPCFFFFFWLEASNRSPLHYDS